MHNVQLASLGMSPSLVLAAFGEIIITIFIFSDMRYSTEILKIQTGKCGNFSKLASPIYKALELHSERFFLKKSVCIMAVAFKYVKLGISIKSILYAL